MKKILLFFMLLNTNVFAMETVNCNSAQRDDLNAMANYVNNNWDEFEDYVDRNTGINLKSCIKNRFKKNGKVICEDSCAPNVNGWAAYLSKKVHFCPLFLNNVAKLDRKVSRRACYFALAVHEFGHNCLRGHGTVEDLDNAAFDWYEQTHPRVNITLASCGMD